MAGITMVQRKNIEERIFFCLVLFEVAIFGRLAWCFPDEAQIMFLDEPTNATFDSFETNYSDETFTINTVGCVIPASNIQSVPIKKYSEGPKNRHTKLCKNYKQRLLESNQTHIWVNKENFIHYNIKHDWDFVCCYKSFHRPLSSRNISRNIVDDRIQYLGCIMFHESIEVNNEFVKVRCYYGTKVMYNQYFIFTPKKPFTFNRDTPFKRPQNQSAYNVLIMGIGSMSRQNFYRTMPETLELLKKYEAIELKGYNTVAHDTFRNMIPVLVGMNNSEIDSTCWPQERTTLDSCPFVWERFKDVGYYTALAEDTSKFGMFNKGKFGFRGSPTDYYLHPFIHESESLSINKKRKRQHVSSEIKEPEYVIPCMGDKYYFEVLLDYVARITTTLRNSKLFGLFWETSMSHDNLNDPINMDKAYVKLIEELDSTGYLNETILIFLSDHGMDIGTIRFSKQGRIERRLPFVFILAPPSFQKNFRLAFHNLKVNRGRLTTPFDMHKTLVDLIDMTDISEREILRRSTEFYTHDRGISLFLQIPRNRTCEMAGISNTWCACYNDVKIPLDNPFLLDGIKFLTEEVNLMLMPYPECLKLVVDDVIVAKEMVPVYEKSVEWRDFNFIVRMAPGGGIFETMMRLNRKKWTIVDHIKRLNFPGFRSLCVDDPNLKLFCYCK